MRILNVADFNWMTGAERDTVRLSLFDIRRKFTHAATRADHLVVEFSDRAVARSTPPLGLKALAGRNVNRRFLQTVDELKPDLIFLHFADLISNAALHEAKALSPGVIIADIHIDPIDTAKARRRLALRQGVANALFVTTAEPALGAYAGAGAFAAFMPNPVDPAIETGRGFETSALPYDLLFAAHDNLPREMGEDRLSPFAAVRGLRERVAGLRLNTPGIAGQAEVGGTAYFAALQSARMGWSLSRRASAPLYASDRMAHILGWGLTALVDRRSGFQRFYGDDEMVFYDDLDDLAGKLIGLIGDDARARDIARRGWETTWRLFHSSRVFGYVLAQLGRDGGAQDYEWPTERWSA